MNLRLDYWNYYSICFKYSYLESKASVRIALLIDLIIIREKLPGLYLFRTKNLLISFQLSYLIAILHVFRITHWMTWDLLETSSIFFPYLDKKKWFPQVNIRGEPDWWHQKQLFMLLWESLHAIICIVELLSVMCFIERLLFLFNAKSPEALVLVNLFPFDRNKVLRTRNVVCNIFF